MSDLQPLGAKKTAAIVALLGGASQTAAAKAAGVNPRTLRTWLTEDPNFRANLRAAEAEAVSGMSRRLLGLGDLALDALADLLTDDETPDGLKLRTAQIVLERFMALRELADLETRIVDLEAQLQ